MALRDRLERENRLPCEEWETLSQRAEILAKAGQLEQDREAKDAACEVIADKIEPDQRQDQFLKLAAKS